MSMIDLTMLCVMLRWMGIANCDWKICFLPVMLEFVAGVVVECVKKIKE